MSLPLTQHGGPGAEPEPEPQRAAFYFDFSSPDAYLAAERVLQTLPYAAEWIPIRSPREWAVFRCAEEERIAREQVERTAAERALQAVRWPPAFDSELALRAATYAKQIGRVVAFSLAAFRQAYAGGHDLGDRDVILIAASACEMHPRAVLQALERDAVVRALDAATALAAARGVLDVPAVWTPAGTVFHGDAALETAAAAGAP
ncbi:MAG TPA: DsbA family protein [Baekduia sp.]|nr:DsbA family protein [Baekduia sp.]